jgi:hypothetical protein
MENMTVNIEALHWPDTTLIMEKDWSDVTAWYRNTEGLETILTSLRNEAEL